MDSETNFNTPSECPTSSSEPRVMGAADNSTSGSNVPSKSSPLVVAPRTVIVMRHGERVDELFPDWIERCRDGYTPYDANMPPTLAPLKRAIDDFDEDTPLTQMGHIMAQMVGRGLLLNGLVPEAIYASPAFRCVQTAHDITKMCNSVRIRVEPGLFENIGLYKRRVPTWLDMSALHAAGINVDVDYRPFFSRQDIWFTNEDALTYNRRINATFNEIFKNEHARNPDGCILICAHASTVDLLAGYFAVPRRLIAESDLIGISKRVPYCATAVFRRQTTTPEWFYYGDSILPAITYRGFTSRLDNRFLTRKGANF